jgi:hypothetical protein
VANRLRRVAATVAVAAAAVSVGACGSTTAPTKTVTVTKVVATSAATITGSTAAEPPRSKPSTAYKRCDANIRARKVTTTCGFAENAFYAYYKSGGATTLRVWSPAVHRTFSTRCTRSAGVVTCRTADRGVVKFAQSAVNAYDEDQAAAFAAAHETGNATSTPSTPASSASAGEVPDNGTAEDDTDSGSFCDTHDCIPNYPNGNGSTVQCADGSYSHSGGIQGACSHHGGVG